MDCWQLLKVQGLSSVGWRSSTCVSSSRQAISVTFAKQRNGNRGSSCSWQNTLSGTERSGFRCRPNARLGNRISCQAMEGEPESAESESEVKPETKRRTKRKRRVKGRHRVVSALLFCLSSRLEPSAFRSLCGYCQGINFSGPKSIFLCGWMIARCKIWTKATYLYVFQFPTDSP
jgi:hypothetical protein